MPAPDRTHARTCAACPSSIAPGNKSGRCRSCAAALAYNDPAKRERRLAALRVALASPETRAIKCVAAQKRERDRRGDASWHAYKVASGRRLRRAYEASEEGQAKNAAARAEVGRKLSEQRNGWMPDHHHARWLPRYQQLRKAASAPEARAAVLREIAQGEMALLDPEAAAVFLARVAPTYQCDATGRPKRWGGFWRCGTAILDRAGLIERAARRGWQRAAHLAGVLV